jgi:hypothetical protein
MCLTYMTGKMLQRAKVHDASYYSGHAMGQTCRAIKIARVDWAKSFNCPFEKNSYACHLFPSAPFISTHQARTLQSRYDRRGWEVVPVGQQALQRPAQHSVRPPATSTHAVLTAVLHNRIKGQGA